MNTFKRKALMSAVLAGLGVAGSAEAVYRDPNGLGQALIYPYYTVQSSAGNPYYTLISVVNTTTRAKVVKVRFLEGKASAEVLDFNLYLSPNDMWTAGILAADATATSPGRLVTNDVSCTNPAIPATGVDFRNFTYIVGGDSLPGIGLDRTREGYLEMIEMGTLTGTAAAAVTHGATGTPTNCAAVVGDPITLLSVEAPTGGLSGTGTLINVLSGQDFTYNADALGALFLAANVTAPSLVTPNLSSADAMSTVINSGAVVQGITVYRTDWNVLLSGVTGGARASAATFMHTSIMNEYVLDSGSQSLTDWVITMPTKRYFVSSTTAATPFTNVLTTAGACETIGFTFFNREEASATTTGANFSPLPPAGQPNSLCWESTVLSVKNGATHIPTASSPSALLGSVNNTNVTVSSTFQNGWAILSFAGANATGTNGMAGALATSDRVNPLLAGQPIAFGAVTYYGLPSTGFMVRSFKNGNLACGTATCQGNYGGLFTHNYRTLVTP